MIAAKYYGYKHWTLEETPRCFYVGKGIEARSRDVWQRSHKWRAIVKRFGLHIEVCVGPATNAEACAWEIEQIAAMGTFTTNHSHDDPNDIGCNLTRGGDGGWRPWSEAQRLHAHVRYKQVWADPKLRQAMSETLKLVGARPEVKQNRTRIMKKRWANFKTLSWVTLTCQHCSREFQDRPSRAKRKFCSRDCKYGR